MTVYDLDGRQHSWNLTGHIPAHASTRPRSEYHLRARALLKEVYPNDIVLEEVPLPGIGLFADFYLPRRRTLVEAHGEQHYKFVQHFHGTVMGFLESKKRDAAKAAWCEVNNIRLVVLCYQDSDDIWKKLV